MADAALDKVPWEQADAKDRGNELQMTFNAVLDEQGSYRTETLRHLRLYRNLNNIAYLTSYGPTAIVTPLSLNVIRAMTNEVHSKVTKHRVKVTMQTSGASYERRELAQKLDAYALGLTLKEQLHRQTRLAFLDCVVTGTGVMKTFADKPRKRVRFERKFSPNCVVDLAEGAYLCPAHYYEIDYVDRSLLTRRYPDKKDAIAGAKKATSTEDEFFLFNDSPSADLVQVVTGWWFNPDDEFDGFKSVVVNSHELEGGEYNLGNPFSVMRWSTSNLGWYGMGLAEEIKGIQLEINRLIRKIQNAQSLLSNPYVLADRASNIARGQLTDIPGSVILFNGKEPRVVAPAVMNAEVYHHLDRLYQRAYEIARLTRMNVPAKATPYESGRAKLIDEDTESDSFADVHRQWDDLHVDCIQKGIRAARSIPGYKVAVWGKDMMEVLDFKKDIDLEEDEWLIRPMPTALLGETPPAQIDNIDRFLKMGIIDDPDDLLDQVDSPDVKAFLRGKTSPKRLIKKVVSSMLAGGPYIGPEPEMNLALALEVANEMYTEMRLIDGFPKERLRNVRQFMVRTKDLIKMAAGPSNVPTMGAVASPGGAPPLPGASAPMPAPAPNPGLAPAA